MSGQRALLLGALCAALGLAVLLASHRLWWSATEPGSFFGGDLAAYQAAAERLVATGSPYHPDLVAGPIANVVANIPIGYFYPPPLAQVFTLFAEWPPGLVKILWVSAQIGALVGALWLLVRSAYLSVRPETILLVSLAAVTYFPLQFALYGGNVSGWLAIAVALLLTAGPGTKGVTVSLLALIKLTPLPFVAAAVADPAVRRYVLVACGGTTIMSVVIAPSAWASWFTILPNLAGNPMGQVANYSPASVVAAAGLPILGAVLGWSLAIGFAVVAVLTARRRGFGPQAIAAATGSMTLASPTLWDHYLAVLLPLVVYSWVRSGPRARLLFWTFHLVTLAMWFGFGGLVLYDGMVLVLTVTVTAVIVAAPMAASSAQIRPGWLAEEGARADPRA